MLGNKLLLGAQTPPVFIHGGRLYIDLNDEGLNTGLNMK
jgi:hypothetical protein